ncbi:MAG: glycosyltransferase family A protein [Rubrimonas sp.]
MSPKPRETPEVEALAHAWPGDGRAPDGWPWSRSRAPRTGSGASVIEVAIRAGGGAASARAAVASVLNQDYPALRLSVIGQPLDDAEAATLRDALTARYGDGPSAEAAARIELACGETLTPGALAHAADFFPGCAALSAAAIETDAQGSAVLRPGGAVWRATAGGRGVARSFAPLLLRRRVDGAIGPAGGGLAAARARWLAEPFAEQVAGDGFGRTGRRLVLATLTRDRPASLRRCLTSLAAMTPPADVDVELLIVDNGSAPAALAAARGAVAGWGGPWPARLVIEPEPGIPAARNRAVAEALAAGADALVFLDDDQTAPPDWLATLCHVWRAEAADIVKTPVLWAFDPPARHVEQFFGGLERLDRPGPARTVIGRHVSTDGVLIGRRVLDDMALRFDPAMRVCGGSDTEFFARAHAAGARAILTRESYAVEHCPPAKQTARWLMRRAWRVGAVEGAMRACGRSRARYVAKGLFLAPLHALAAALTVWRPAFSLRQMIRAARAFGLASGACGLRSREYARIVGR